MTTSQVAFLVALNLVGFGGILYVILTKLSNLSSSEKWLRDLPTRDEWSSETRRNREELQATLKSFNDSVLKQMADIATLQKHQLDAFQNTLKQLSESNNQNLDKMRDTIEKNLKALQEDNNKKLEQMRATVDEKLQSTLEKRLGESFKLVSDRLEQVHKGLGEMQNLASGVGDLKKVLTNVKTRGTWGEIQLESLLEQLLTADQYEKNVKIKPKSTEFVEFAVKLPGKDPDDDTPVWLPIDAKFPQEMYQHVLTAQEEGDAEAVETATKQLEMSIKKEARTIRDKYIDPPRSTDFGILFLPTEGLYAEVLRRPGLHESLQRDYRVMIAGPTTLSALLNSLQMGFRTLAIEKRSSEVWKVLGGVKQEFVKFGDILDKTKKKLQEASNTIESAASKSRNIERKLNKVESISPAEEQPEEPLEIASSNLF
jgi:DNA recombination protein RmuC